MLSLALVELPPFLPSCYTKLFMDDSQKLGFVWIAHVFLHVFNVYSSPAW